jgi:hypothetical protein
MKLAHPPWRLRLARAHNLKPTACQSAAQKAETETLK